MIVIGIDPDSVKHGVAVYADNKLVELDELSLVDLVTTMIVDAQDTIFSIENVLANNFIYTRNNKSSKALQAKVGLSVGRCQQAQQELMRFLDYYTVPYVLHKPQKGNWAKDKAQFQQLTGWSKRSNAETRSAAFFGWLALGKVIHSKSTII